jgi:miniconductance mechanosensitive channel
MDAKYLLDISSFLNNSGLPSALVPWINMFFGLVVIFILAWLSDIISRKVILQLLRRLAKKTATNWDDIILEKRVFNRLVHLIPALIVYSLIGIVFKEYQQTLAIVRALINVYMIVMVLLAIDSFINSLHQIYQTLKISKDRSIHGYIQVVKILIYFVAVILIISVLFNKKPNVLFAGLGAMAAVLILVFKDTILGFVASIQLSANDMVKIGDWISMPSHGADGDVLEVTLNTVKVQNWDKTISTIPTYALVSESFNNWRGMAESGGRRIKRHINLDMKSVKFCSPEMISKFKKIQYLANYIEQKEKEIADYNEKNGIDSSVLVNGRRMTNIGTFRFYLEEYLRNNPKIHKEMTFLVRQLQSTEKGIPIEIYVFSNDQAWANYEGIQSDIFDHILAILPEFELSVFQNPTGDDFRNLSN